MLSDFTGTAIRAYQGEREGEKGSYTELPLCEGPGGEGSRLKPSHPGR